MSLQVVYRERNSVNVGFCGKIYLGHRGGDVVSNIRHKVTSLFNRVAEVDRDIILGDTVEEKDIFDHEEVFQLTKLINHEVNKPSGKLASDGDLPLCVLFHNTM